MKVDVVSCYYDQAWCAPLFWWGIEQNLEHIDRVFVVKDGPWEDGEVSKLAEKAPTGKIDFVPLWNPKVAHGVATSHNLGISMSDKDYVFLTGFDIIMQKGCVQAALARAYPDVLVTGEVDTISSDTTVGELPHPKVTRHDRVGLSRNALLARQRPWLCFHNGHALVPKEATEVIGGFDEAFAFLGYGLEDNEFAARWCKHHGFGGIQFSQGSCWHLGSAAPSSEERAKKMPTPEAFTILCRTLMPLYGNNIRLFVGDKGLRSETFRVNVRHEDQGHVPGVDVVQDCTDPFWVPVDCVSIATRVDVDYFSTREEVEEHVQLLLGKLRPGGILRVVTGLYPRESLLPLLGKEFEVDMVLGGLEICKEFD